jgi:hypothetical protein|tara:strand:+ start:288 stop:506 length:219 start_codon:yes stop_codon:yes gene_type:complete
MSNEPVIVFEEGGKEYKESDLSVEATIIYSEWKADLQQRDRLIKDIRRLNILLDFNKSELKNLLEGGKNVVS